MLSSLLALQHEFLSLNSFIFVVGLLVCLLVSALLKRFNVHQLPESAAFMLVGFLGGCLAQFSSEAEKQFITFSPNFVFFIILPPIILDAGYTLKRKDFFDSLAPVLLLATLGTIVNNLVFGYLMYALAQADLIPLDSNSPLECLLFGSLISATDPVATLSLMGSKMVNADPMLYSLVMGESVLNDAIAIVLFKAFEASVIISDDGLSVNAKPFEFTELIMALLSFLGVSLGSVACGVVIGLLCSLLCKRVNLALFPISELSLVTLMAFLAYFTAELLSLSGIMSLFFCSICLAHYCYYSLTPVAQVALHESFRSNAQIAETALYALLGVSTGLSLKGSFVIYSIPLIAATIFFALLARAVHVFPLCHVANIYRVPSARISVRMQIPLWFAGLRGGVCFALSLSFPGPHRSLIMGATLMLVLFTTFIGGGLTLPLLRCTGMTSETQQGVEQQQERLEHDEYHAPHSQQRGDDEDEVDVTVPELHDSHELDSLPPPSASTPRVHGLAARFKDIDERYLRAWFGQRTSMRDARGTMHALPRRRSVTHLQRRGVQLAQKAAELSPGTPFPLSEESAAARAAQRFHFDASVPVPMLSISTSNTPEQSLTSPPTPRQASDSYGLESSMEASRDSSSSSSPPSPPSTEHLSSHTLTFPCAMRHHDSAL